MRTQTIPRNRTPFSQFYCRRFPFVSISVRLGVVVSPRALVNKRGRHMVEVSRIRAVLFAKDLQRVTDFYCEALGLERSAQDQHHTLLGQSSFELIVHQIPEHIAATIEIADPPDRREGGSLRLDYPVASLELSRSSAASYGGRIDEDPPSWAERGANFFLGCDPEGDVFGVSEQTA